MQVVDHPLQLRHPQLSVFQVHGIPFRLPDVKYLGPIAALPRFLTPGDLRQHPRSSVLYHATLSIKAIRPAAEQSTRLIGNKFHF